MKCIFCGKKLNKGSASKWCSKSCYNKDYYYKHKDILSKRHSEWWKARHPKKIVESKYKSEEEKKEAQIKARKEYYQAHKEMYKKRNKEWYAKHRNDPDVKHRHAIAMKKYHQKRRQNKEI